MPPRPSGTTSSPTKLANDHEDDLSDSINPLTYPYTPTEKLVLTLEPYKSALLPFWRFKTPAVARESSTILWEKFLEFDDADDFVGMDMARKFIQMGMTRSKRYANYSGGRKYAKGASKDGEAGGEREQLPVSEHHDGKKDKEEASAIFREVWEKCKEHEGYVRRKEEWMEETRRLKREAKERAERDSGARSSANAKGQREGRGNAQARIRRQRKAAMRKNGE